MFFRVSLVIILCWVSSDLCGQPGIRSVVVEKTVSNAKRAWDVYSDEGMEHVVGSVNPGDSVRVFTWKPWVYRIETNSIGGYVSWRAILITPALRKMARELESKSDSLIRISVVADSLQKYKNLRYWLPVLEANALSESRRTINDATLPSDQSAFLRLSASDTNIDVGECTTVNLSFYVSEFNRLPLQFHDLAEQLSSMMDGPLHQLGGWNGDGNISDVKAIPVKINGLSFTEYRLFTRAYCPDEAKPIEFKEVQLSLMKIDRKTKQETPMIFTSKPLKINVRAAVTAGATTADFFKLTGKFIVVDSVYRYKSGSPLVYTITLKGKGLSFPLRPPQLTGKDFAAEFVSMNDADTILNDVYYSSKTFTWNLFLKEGTHKLWQQPVFSAYDPADKKIKPILLNRIIPVMPGKSNYADVPNRGVPDHFILVDVSQSMMIEDYPPNRLGMVKNGLYDFLTRRSACDVELITFSGEALRFDISKNDGCYSGEQIRKIDFHFNGARGTAIGDAVWLAVHSISPTAAVKKIVIIGDGENTTGYTNFSRAIALANNYKVVVYTIGIGKNLLVPFGRDPNGNILKIQSNFTDVMLKQIANQTGGKYFHAETAADVTRFLKEILPE